jgi:hypothetical protein
MITKEKLSIICICIILAFGIILIDKTLTMDSQTRDYKDIQSVIHGDASGYYVYLPALFIYNFDADNFPDDIEKISGNGFELTHGKVKSKYPLGVAIAYSPFFLVAHIISKEKDGFSRDYHRSMRIAAVFYCVLGLLFCFLFFSRYINQFVALISLIPLFYGTNLIYYTLKCPCYSHALSFCLIACFLYCISMYKRNPLHWCKWLLPLVFGFIISVRMLNGIVIFLLPFWDFNSFNDSFSFTKKIIRDYKLIIAFVVSVLLFQAPQFLYNLYLNGTILSEMYPGETFTNKTHPEWKLVLFGAYNGLYIYAPVFLLFTASNFIVIQERFKNGVLVLFYFILVILIYASWWSPALGCAFGHRGLLDFTALFAFPFVLVIDYLFIRKKWILLLLIAVIVYCCCYITLGIYGMWWYCFYGKGDYDFFKLIDDYFSFYHLKF